MKKLLLFLASVALAGCASSSAPDERDQSAPTDGVGYTADDPTFIRSDADPLERHKQYIGSGY